MIKFEKGKTWDNKSKKYLIQCLREAPHWIKDYILKAKISNKSEFANVTGFFRSDLEYVDATRDEHKHLLFVLVDINGEFVEKIGQYKSIELGRREFRLFLKEFRKNKKFGHYDYVFGDLYHSHRHVFVFDMSTWSNKVEAFDKGDYSKMFTSLELKKLNITKTIGGKPNGLWETFTGNKDNRELLKKRLERQFKTVLKESDVPESNELDTPPQKKDEWLNLR